jgi:cell division septum initiation protein DivIVA
MTNAELQLENENLKEEITELENEVFNLLNVKQFLSDEVEYLDNEMEMLRLEKKAENFKFHFELKRQEKIIEIITGNEKRVRYTSYIPIFYYDLEWED